MLQARQLTLWRGARRLFEDLSFEVRSGAALVLRGPNGSGKTTLLRVLAGLTRPEAGSIAWRGQPCSAGLLAHAAYSGHQYGLNADLTVRQNLDFYARLARRPSEAAALLELLGLAACADLEARYLSAGQKRRAAMARLLMSVAPVWLLDEPMTNLDAAGQTLVQERVAAHLAAGGVAVVAAHGEFPLQAGRSETLAMGSA